MAIEPAFGAVPSLLVLISDSHDIQGSPTDEEALAVSRAVAKRRREFAAGRSLARQGLLAMGVQPVSIPVSPRRYPVWPAGIAGSISHTNRHVGVALARTRHYVGVGLDLELRDSVAPNLFRSIVTEGELEQLPAQSPTEVATLLFSCKESVFKAVNPTVDEFLDFLDVRIELADGGFRACCSRARRSAEMVNGGEGYFEIADDLVRSLFLIR
jgi:4'-phosphopantetheinyl transferase EntD